MLKKLVWMLVAFPAALLLITLAVANRHSVKLVLDPFKPADPTIYLQLPMFAYLFGAMFIGLLIGGFVSWINQGRWRRTARDRTHEAYKWKHEADRLAQDRDTAQRPALTSS